MENIMELIERHLDEAGCSKKYRGYEILARVIELDIEQPLLSCTELFKYYVSSNPKARGRGKASMDGWWLRAYKNARHCFLNSEGSVKYDGVYGFIKEVSSEVKKELARA